MKSNVLFLLILLSFIQVSGQENKILNSFDFNGYMQIRGMSNFDDNTSFSLRRLKLWIISKPEFSSQWSYKIQTTFTSSQQEEFFLQDVMLSYKTESFTFDIGQFVPQYSLQRFQSDYILPAIERTEVINILIPNGKLGVRDIGVQANYSSKNKIFVSHFGIFNGYGINEYRLNNNGYMITHKTEFNIHAESDNIKLGYSLQYRNAEDLQLKYIFPDSVRYSGSDFRYNLFAMFKSKSFEFQGEFLNADFRGERAFGYYFLSAINYLKNQLVLSIENYNDLINETSDKPYYRIGYNYLISSHKIKLSIDNYFQINKQQLEKYYASIQLQMLLN